MLFAVLVKRVLVKRERKCVNSLACQSIIVTRMRTMPSEFADEEYNEEYDFASSDEDEECDEGNDMRLSLLTRSMTLSKLRLCQMLLSFKISLDDTDNDNNDIVLDILKPRSLTAAAPQFIRRSEAPLAVQFTP